MRNPHSPLFCDAPAGDGFPGYDIITPRGAEVLVGVVQSRRVVGCMTHWVDDRSVPCPGSKHGCIHCLRSAVRRWRGYLWFILKLRSRLSILQLTEQAVYPHHSRLTGRSCPIAGAEAKVRREGGMSRGKVILALGPGDPAKALPEFDLPDLQKTLLRIWYGPTGGWDGPRLGDAGDGPELIPLPAG